MIWRNILKKRSGGGATSVWRPVIVPALAGSYVQKIVYGNGRWLMIALISGAYYPLVSTDDGETWSTGGSIPTSWVEYLPAAGLFVCCSPSAILTSADGLSWAGYAPPNADVGALRYLGVFQDKLLGVSANGSNDKSARTADAFSWSATSSLPSNPSGGSYDGTKPIACGPSRALVVPQSSSYWSTDDGATFTIQSAPAATIFGNAAYGFGAFFASDSTGTVPTSKVYKSGTGLTGSWATLTLPETIQRGASVSATSDAIIVLGSFAFDGIGNKAAISLDGNSFTMTGYCGNATYQPRALKGVGKRFIAAGPTTVPPYHSNTIYIYEVP